MTTFQFNFDELPLVIAGGIEAAFINGVADIKYSADGEWTVEAVTVEGFGERVNGKRTWPQVQAPEALETIIRQRLYGEWFFKAQEAVNEQITTDRECAADNAADYRRDRMMERA